MGPDLAWAWGCLPDIRLTTAPVPSSHRRRELRFCQPADQGEAEAVSTAAAAAVEAVNTAAASRTPGAVKRGGESGPLESSSALGFEVQLSGSPDEDVEVL